MGLCIPGDTLGRNLGREIHEVDPIVCHKCGGTVKATASITEYSVVDRIINHLKLTFVAEKPPQSHVFEQVAPDGGRGEPGLLSPANDFNDTQPRPGIS